MIDLRTIAPEALIEEEPIPHPCAVRKVLWRQRFAALDRKPGTWILLGAWSVGWLGRYHKKHSAYEFTQRSKRPDGTPAPERKVWWYGRRRLGEDNGTQEDQ